MNVVAYRLPLGKSFINGRSKCPFCVKEIAPYDLVPILSFFILKRRCRNCRAEISWQYPLVEILFGLILAVSFWLFVPVVSIFYWLCFVFIAGCLLILAIVDSQHFILPDFLMLAIGVAWLALSVFNSRFNPAEFAKLSVAGIGWSAVLFLAVFLLWRFSDGKWIGLGDAKLVGLLGLVWGVQNAVYILYLAVIVGSLAGLIIIALGKGGLKTKLPFGAFICFSAIFFMFFGFGLAENALLFIRHLIVDFGLV